jgi:hypothetical protein
MHLRLHFDADLMLFGIIRVRCRRCQRAQDSDGVRAGGTRASLAPAYGYATAYRSSPGICSASGKIARSRRSASTIRQRPIRRQMGSVFTPWPFRPIPAVQPTADPPSVRARAALLLALGAFLSSPQFPLIGLELPVLRQ